jgi:hypothetical protein
MSRRPIVSACVQYLTRGAGSHPVAAIITGVEADRVSLRVFEPGITYPATATEGTVPGCWRWPPQEDSDG